MKLALMICFSVALAGGSRASDFLEFSGYLVASGDTRFILTNLETHAVSGLLVKGESFEGHTVVAFDIQEEIISLKKDAVTFRLKVKNSRVVRGETLLAKNIVALSIARDGGMTFSGRIVDSQSLRLQLISLAAREPDMTLVFLTPHPGTFEVTRVIGEVMRLSRDVGFKKLSFARWNER